MLCDDLEGWDEGKGGRLKREGRYIYIYIKLWLIHVAVQQKLIQHCKKNFPSIKNFRIDYYFKKVGFNHFDFILKLYIIGNMLFISRMMACLSSLYI